MRLVIRDLSKTYPNGTRALKDVSLDVLLTMQARVVKGQLGDLQRLDSPNSRLEGSRRVPVIHGTLRVEPELGRIAEQAGEPKRHLRTNDAPLPQQFIHRLAGDTQGPGESRSREPVVRKEILPKLLARMAGPDFPPAGVRRP
jgi:hypothetical protein